MSSHSINSAHITIQDVERILNQNQAIELSSEAKEGIERCRSYLDQKMANNTKPIYGINTGFGSLCNTEINSNELEQLQENLVLSHACGMGQELHPQIVKLMLLLKVQGLAYGHSGVQLQTVERLVFMFNNEILPVIYEQGSLGASGDLAPLAHLVLPLINRGEVHYKGKKQSAIGVNTTLKLEAIKLQSKEGLALLNGTQFMSAIGVHICIEAEKLMRWANRIAALSIDAFDGRIEPFSDLPHLVRKQGGQLRVAREIRSLLSGSEIIQQAKNHVQDPYSFRCIPQVHGAVWDVFAFVNSIFENEINSVTDNPTIFPDEDEIISAGNFHGQPLAMALDQMAIALAELGSISERRTYKLISGQRNLPAFLVANPGLNSGFMIPQYSAASMVSQSKQLCSPASVDTIDSSNGQEDHVSMGANAATKCLRVLQNTRQVLAIELMNAAQALELRGAERTSTELKQLFTAFRKSVPFVQEDVYMHEYMQKAKVFLEEN